MFHTHEERAGPPFDVPVVRELYTHIGGLMRQQHRHMALLNGGREGSFHGQGRCLYFIGRQPGLTQRQLAEQLHIQPATLSPMLKRIEAQHWIERIRDEQDNRNVRLSLTDEGQRALDERHKAIERYLTLTFQLFGEPKSQQLLSLLQDLEQSMDAALEQCRDTNPTQGA